MILPSTYGVALLLIVFTMLCWGSWANTFKLTGQWRFELFYYDRRRVGRCGKTPRPGRGPGRFRSWRAGLPDAGEHPKRGDSSASRRANEIYANGGDRTAARCHLQVARQAVRVSLYGAGMHRVGGREARPF